MTATKEAMGSTKRHRHPKSVGLGTRMRRVADGRAMPADKWLVVLKDTDPVEFMTQLRDEEEAERARKAAKESKSAAAVDSSATATPEAIDGQSANVSEIIDGLLAEWREKRNSVSGH